MRHIADAKRKENIIEYLLFMWQMEDLLRGVALEVSELDNRIFSSIPEEEARLESLAWFALLARDLKASKAETSGHSSETYEILSELMLLQQTLITVIDDAKFKKLYSQAVPLLSEFRAKTDKLPKSDVETALTAIYGYLTLRLSGKEISELTQAAVDVFSEYLRYLAKAYRDMKAGLLPLNN